MAGGSGLPPKKLLVSMAGFFVIESAAGGSDASVAFAKAWMRAKGLNGVAGSAGGKLAGMEGASFSRAAGRLNSAGASD